MHPEETLTVPTRRRWPVVVAVLLLLTGGGVFVWVVSSSGAMQRAIDFADANDPGWRMPDIEARRATFADADNGAVQVRLAQSLLARGWHKADDGEVLSDLSPPALLNEPQHAAVRAVVAAAGPALPEGRKLAGLPRGRYPLNFTPDYISTILNSQSSRDAASLLRYDALDLIQRNDADDAAAACRGIVNCGGAVGDEPLAISILIRIACNGIGVATLERALAQGEPSEAALAALQARLEDEDPVPLFLNACRGERAATYGLFENIRNGTVSGAALGPAGGIGSPTGLDVFVRLPGVMSRQIAGSLGFMNEMVEVAKRQPEEWEQPLKALDARSRDLPMLARMLVPAMVKVSEACQRNHVNLRAAAAAIAAERYRRKNGRWPQSLTELVQGGLLQAVPTDPYDGQPLRLKATGDGLVIYSVGSDRTDNGGLTDRGKHSTTKGIDLGVRLWDAAKRRQPAPPPKPKTPNGDPPAGGP